MSQEKENALEQLLRGIAAAAPQPFYPRALAAKNPRAVEWISNLLELLWLDGLIEKAASSPEWGPGVQLSPAGAALLADPEQLRRLRDGEPLRANDRGGVVRTILYHRPRGLATQILMGVNIFVFVLGLYLAQTRFGMASDYLTPFVGARQEANDPETDAQLWAAQRKFNIVLHQIGSVSPFDVIHGDWWRLLTCCFVHFGLIHIAFNMYALYAIGHTTEQMWGRWRCLAIYLISGWGASCAAEAFRPSILAGASGAICGILGAEVVWMLLNGRFLPRRVVNRWWTGMGINLVLIAGFSVMANVSALAHFAGFGFGGAAALLLNLHRFGRSRWHALALVLLAALPVAGYGLVAWQRTVNESWKELERRYKDVRQAVVSRDAEVLWSGALAPTGSRSAPEYLRVAANQ